MACADYPFKAPLVKFETGCFHPNVDQYGNICLDILKDKWSAAYSVRTVLLSIQSLLGEPNNDSPLNAYAAKVNSSPLCIKWAACRCMMYLVLLKHQRAADSPYGVFAGLSAKYSRSWMSGNVQAGVLIFLYRGDPSDRLADA